MRLMWVKAAIAALLLSLVAPCAWAEDGGVYRIIVDDRTGIRLALPEDMLSQTEITAAGRHWSSPDGTIAADTLTFAPGEPLKSVYDETRGAAGGTISNDELTPSAFELAGTGSDGREFFMRVREKDGVLKGISITIASSKRAEASTVTWQIAKAFQPFPYAAETLAQRGEELRRNEQPTPQSAEWAAKAQKLEADGNNAGAAAAYRTAIWLDPQNEDARNQFKRVQKHAAAKPMAACSQGAHQIAPADANLKITVAAEDARIGKPVKLKWTLPALDRDPGRPAYLMVMTPDTVRFDGRGFYALAAGAPNPRGVQFGMGRTRTVTPLHTPHAATSGEIEVLPFLAGPLVLEWAIVGADDCGGWTASAGKSDAIEIAAGAPEIITRDEFANTAPDQVLEAANTGYKVHVFKDRFEIYDASGSQIMRRQGYKPAFSPTGRFLVSKTSSAHTYEVIDLIARRIVGRYEANSFSWSHADSFLYVEEIEAAKLDVVRTLHGQRFSPGDRVPTRRLAKMMRLPPGSALYEDVADRRPMAPDVDISPYGTACGRVGSCLAKELWLLDLSIDDGVVTFFDLFHWDTPPQLIVHDLGAEQPNAQFANTDAGREAFAAAFPGVAPVLHGWAAGDTLNDMPLEDTAGEETAEETAEDAPQAEKRAPPAKPATANAAAPAPVISRNPADAGHKTATGIIGAQLSLLPMEPLSVLHGGRDKSALLAVQREIAPFYLPKTLRFVPAPAGNAYLQEPFPDPAALAPAEPAEFTLVEAGRDLWRWQIDGTTYWLTQTVSSNHLRYSLHFTLLASAGGTVRHADLIKAANNPAGEKPQTASGDAYADYHGLYSQYEIGDVRTQLEQALRETSLVNVSGGRYLTIMARPTPKLMVFDLSTWGAVCGVPDPIDGADAVAVTMHADGKHVAQINSDGAVHVYACASGANVLNGAFADDELVMMDRNGYFDGSEDAAGYVELLIPGVPGRHVLSQFTKILKRPGISAEILNGNSEPPLALTAPPALRTIQPNAGGQARVETFSAQGLEKMQVFVEGRLAKEIGLSGTSQELSIATSEWNGLGPVTAVAMDRRGLVSAPLAIAEAPAARAPHGRLFVLAVGINKYPLLPARCGNGRQSCDLRFAAADAQRIAKAVESSKYYAKMAVTTLTDSEASSERVLGQLDGIIAEAAPEDTIAVSFAGHGLVDGNGALVFALSATEMDRIGETSLNFNAVSERLRRSRARVIMLLDVCHAGAADRSTIVTNDSAASHFVTNSGASMIIFSASKGRQFSEETSVKGGDGGGRFSVAFSRILSAERRQHDANRNGFLSVRELYKGLKGKVAGESRGRQTPWLSRNLMVGDFDLF